MFGYVTANTKELTKDQRQRYNAIYCGICRRIRANASQAARLGLSFDMAFLALLLMSLYEPEETSGDRACAIHPLQKRSWVDNEYVSYAADMNVALAYFKANDDIADDGKLSAKLLSGIFGKNLPPIREKYPRQCDAMERCIRELTALERENCGNPDLPAGCFGQLMGELLVYEEDLWAPYLRQLGQGLGRFIYLADAVADFPKDSRKGSYNPLDEACREDWDDYLVLAMGHCTAQYEKLPLVQDKALLDNILYSGVWTNMKRKKKEEGEG